MVKVTFGVGNKPTVRLEVGDYDASFDPGGFDQGLNKVPNIPPGIKAPGGVGTIDRIVGDAYLFQKFQGAVIASKYGTAKLQDIAQAADYALEADLKILHDQYT